MDSKKLQADKLNAASAQAGSIGGTLCEFMPIREWKEVPKLQNMLMSCSGKLLIFLDGCLDADSYVMRR